MIEAAIKAVIYFGVLKLLQPKELPEGRGPIDWWAGFAIMFAAIILTAGVMIGVRAAELPEWLGLVGYLFFLIIPFIFFKIQLDYPAKESIIYSISALGVTILVDFTITVVVVSMAA